MITNTLDLESSWAIAKNTKHQSGIIQTSEANMNEIKSGTTINHTGNPMENCSSLMGCSASICPLDSAPIYPHWVPSDKICPRLLDFLEGNSVPQKEVIERNRPKWENKFPANLFARRLESRQRIRTQNPWTKINTQVEA